MTKSNQSKLIKFWHKEEQQPFTGWNFTYLNNRMIEERPHWSYPSLATALLHNSAALLELGTGGGERMLQLKAHWPEKVVVTEEHPPNFKLAQERLAPLGANVVNVRLTESDPLPFNDHEFDLVLNRHSAFNPAEVARVLAPQGTFLTQQVHGLWAHDLLAAFEAKPPWPHATPDHYVAKLEASGLVIETAEEWQGKLAFTDVGAIVYYLKAVPWLVPSFSVETHIDSLLRLQTQLDNGQPLAFEAMNYLIKVNRVN